MNDEIISDLKQFIATSLAQATSGLPTAADFARMEQKVDDIKLTLDTVADAHAETLAEHEQRIQKLEQQVA